MMSIMKQKMCVVKSCDEMAEKTFLLRLISSEIAAAAQPGHFVNVLAADFGEGPLLRRPFSISRIDGDVIELLFHVIGEGTLLLTRKRAGDTIDVVGPLGQSFHMDGAFDTALIVAGGIGVAPFPFLTEELQKRGKQIETFLGYRNARQIISSNLANVHLATDDGSQGFHGNVVQLLEQFLDHTNLGKAKIFGCGPTVMLRALKELAHRKTLCCEISLEGQMACGVGICQGCPVERTGKEITYALVCKEGPTFLTTEVNL
jgi:dihydroorotate dehydrogenase electron transfer subunit